MEGENDIGDDQRILRNDTNEKKKKKRKKRTDTVRLGVYSLQ